MGKRVLIIGKGGREHTLGWKIAQSPLVEKVYFTPGNVGTAEVGENVDIKSFTKHEDIDNLAKLAEQLRIDLTISGPEDPYVNGIVDEFRERGLPIFGPTRAASILEGSKCFSQNLKERYNIPTPLPCEHFREGGWDTAIDYLYENWRNDRKFVVKADGLAAGKGVIVCNTKKQAYDAVIRFMRDRELGDAGAKILIERRLYGWELSSIGLTDGETYLPLAYSQDNKKAYINSEDREEFLKFVLNPHDFGLIGPNTGGMGAYSPVPSVTPELDGKIREKIMIPTIRAMEQDYRTYQGVLYAGLIIVKENGKETPVDLEYNCRFGDPETEAVMVRMKSDLVPYLFACMDRTLDKMPPIQWRDVVAISVVMASGGYPIKDGYETGKVISGLDEVKKMKNVIVFHSGTKKENGPIYTDDGRVLTVTALGLDYLDARESVYDAAKLIKFANMYFRKDIGTKWLSKY
jgi:phosphoribosylamine--glycine ligase